MKKIGRLYIITITLSVATAAVTTHFLFPSDLFLKIFSATLIPLIMLTFGFASTIHLHKKKIRQQLQSVIDTLEQFDMDEPHKIKFKKKQLPLFNELNGYLLELTNRIHTAYHASKQFTQNASHELQTPLSIIKSQAETLLQSPNIGEKEINGLATILQNTNRLSKINTALILLSKIEQQHFTDVGLIDFNKKTEDLLANFQDTLELQEIKINKNISGTFKKEMSDALADILITNLIKNAIRHNSSNYINIEIGNDFFKIINPGKELSILPSELFARFRRDSDKAEGLGLGLSIVKRICEQSGLQVEYLIEKNEHIIWVSR